MSPMRETGCKLDIDHTILEDELESQHTLPRIDQGSIAGSKIEPVEKFEIVSLRANPSNISQNCMDNSQQSFHKKGLKRMLFP